MNAREALRTKGAVLIPNAFPRVLINRLHAAWLRSIAPAAINATEVGHRRYMATVTVTGPFASPGLLLNPKVYPIIRRLLGDDCVLGSFGVVVSFPGAEAQHIHRDSDVLFPENLALSAQVPPHALTLVVPLVDLTPETGGTRIWPGSQGLSSTLRFERRPWEELRPARGSCFLMDYRVMHGGAPNRSAILRPILYLTYTRPWFRDPNFGEQPGVVAASVPRACRRLLQRP